MPPLPIIEELLHAARERLTAGRRLPQSTYRLQFHAGFTFRDAREIVEYLHDLGIAHVYASPIFQARAGSTHGYDVIDPTRLNPELGSEADFASLVSALHAHEMGLIADIVPNHMGVATNDNAWWNDVLEKGPDSQYAGWFDIAWRGSPRPELHDKILLPVLGEPYGKVLESGQLRIGFENGALFVAYWERRFPLSLAGYRCILNYRKERLPELLAQDPEAMRQYAALLESNDLSELKAGLAQWTQRSASAREFIEQNIAAFNGTPGDPRSFDRLDDLLSQQHYRLAYWRTAPDEINYRRFFDINDLAALCMERRDTFEAVHDFPMRLLARGDLDGLRIDHPDGLYDPEQYFVRLQQYSTLATARAIHDADARFREQDWTALRQELLNRLKDGTGVESVGGELPLYVVAEKILAPSEPLPVEWAIHGTSGYDFLVKLNGLFVDPAAAGTFTRAYQEWTVDPTSFEEWVYREKRLILRIALASELQMLSHQLDRLAQRARSSRDFTQSALRMALREVIACFPVYRSYISRPEVDARDVRYVENAVRAAIERNPSLDAGVFHFIRDALLQQYPDTFTPENRAAQFAFAGKFQQVTAPVTAKGVEDTAFYIYNRLVSLNEVGGDPGCFGIAPDALHRWMIDRQANWPFALSPLSTHDTKRSEDVRARLNVLSEIPEEWWRRVRRWSALNEPQRPTLDGRAVPDPNEEYLLYQTLLGAWPIGRLEGDQREIFVKRMQAYMQKALREAKTHTSWTSPRADYEAAVSDFVARILDERASESFLRDLGSFERRLSHFGLLNSLSQTLVRLTAPGVPDTYQGTELWDLSLVDPDNRRPVDYQRRSTMLAQLQSRAREQATELLPLAKEMIAQKEDGRVKLWITWRALSCRRDSPGLFSAGEYLPLDAMGRARENVFAFLRRAGNKLAIVAVPRLLCRLSPAAGEPPVGEAVWSDTQLLLPQEAAGLTFCNALTGERLNCVALETRPALPLRDVFGHFPVALLTAPIA